MPVQPNDGRLFVPKAPIVTSSLAPSESVIRLLGCPRIALHTSVLLEHSSRTSYVSAVYGVILSRPFDLTEPERKRHGHRLNSIVTAGVPLSLFSPKYGGAVLPPLPV